MATIITFYMIVLGLGPRPITYDTPAASIEECIGMVAVAMARINAIESPDRLYQIGCSVKVPKIETH